MKVYLCGPITGMSYEDCYRDRERVQWALEAFGYTVLNPLRDKEELKGEGKLEAGGYTKGSILTTAEGFFTRDLMWVDQADVVFALFDNATRVSVGSCVEIGYAYSRGKVIVTVGDEYHNHPFITKCSNIYTSNLEEAIKYLGTLYV